jgi:hypothetical protein
MDDDSPPSATGKPSQVPSWVTLGFVLGALFVWALPRHEGEDPAAHPAEAAPAKPSPPPAPPRITTIEAVFDAWGKYAVWNDDTTEVALWNSETMNFSDCFEVVRVGDNHYFRSIPRLTRPVLTHGIDEKSALPLEFTETQRQRDEWMAEVHKESWKEFYDANRQQLAPTVEKKPEGN